MIQNQGEWKMHSGNIITEHKTQGEWKIYLAMTINFISFKENRRNSETDKIIEELFESYL